MLHYSYSYSTREPQSVVPGCHAPPGECRVVDNWFTVRDPDSDVPFDVARLFYSLKKYPIALKLYMLSWKQVCACLACSPACVLLRVCGVRVCASLLYFSVLLCVRAVRRCFVRAPTRLCECIGYDLFA